jgi:hypothetical protein
MDVGLGGAESHIPRDYGCPSRIAGLRAISLGLLGEVADLLLPAGARVGLPLGLNPILRIDWPRWGTGRRSGGREGRSGGWEGRSGVREGRSGGWEGRSGVREERSGGRRRADRRGRRRGRRRRSGRRSREIGGWDG